MRRGNNGRLWPLISNRTRPLFRAESTESTNWMTSIQVYLAGNECANHPGVAYKRKKHLGTAPGYRIVGKTREKKLSPLGADHQFFTCFIIRYSTPGQRVINQPFSKYLFQTFSSDGKTLNGRHLLSVVGRLTSHIFPLKMFQTVPLNTTVQTASRRLGGLL